MRLSSVVLLKNALRFRADPEKGPDQHSSAISLRIAHYRPSSVNEALFYENLLAAHSSLAAGAHQFAPELWVLAGEIRNRAPLLHAVVGQA
jgi:hypothetical protein